MNISDSMMISAQDHIVDHREGEDDDDDPSGSSSHSSHSSIDNGEAGGGWFGTPTMGSAGATTSSKRTGEQRKLLHSKSKRKDQRKKRQQQQVLVDMKLFVARGASNINVDDDSTGDPLGLPDEGGPNTNVVKHQKKLISIPYTSDPYEYLERSVVSALASSTAGATMTQPHSGVIHDNNNNDKYVVKFYLHHEGEDDKTERIESDHDLVTAMREFQEKRWGVGSSGRNGRHLTVITEVFVRDMQDMPGCDNWNSREATTSLFSSLRPSSFRYMPRNRFKITTPVLLSMVVAAVILLTASAVLVRTGLKGSESPPASVTTTTKTTVLDESQPAGSFTMVGHDDNRHRHRQHDDEEMNMHTQQLDGNYNDESEGSGKKQKENWNTTKAASVKDKKMKKDKKNYLDDWRQEEQQKVLDSSLKAIYAASNCASSCITTNSLNNI